MTRDAPGSKQDDGPEDMTILAAEYALGLLDPTERALFEALMAEEPEAERAMRAWQETFSTLAQDLPPVQASPAALPRLEMALFGPAQASAPAQAATETTLGAVRATGRAMRRFWQGVALGAGGLAAGAAVLVLLLPGALDRVVPPSVPVTQGPVTQASSPVFAAEISGDAGLRLLAVFDPVQGDLRLARTEGGAVPGRVLELWVIADGAAPVSLGVLPEGASANVAVPEALRLAVASGLLAISDEPLGGSPTGAPTGAVLATGPVTAL